MANSATKHVLTAETLANGNLDKKQKPRPVAEFSIPSDGEVEIIASGDEEVLERTGTALTAEPEPKTQVPIIHRRALPATYDRHQRSSTSFASWAFAVSAFMGVILIVAIAIDWFSHAVW